MTSRRWRWIPNALTFLRIFLIIPFAAALWLEQYRPALGIFFIAAATDACDGYLRASSTGAPVWGRWRIRWRTRPF